MNVIYPLSSSCLHKNKALRPSSSIHQSTPAYPSSDLQGRDGSAYSRLISPTCTSDVTLQVTGESLLLSQPSLFSQVWIKVYSCLWPTCTELVYTRSARKYHSSLSAFTRLMSVMFSYVRPPSIASMLFTIFTSSLLSWSTNALLTQQ